MGVGNTVSKISILIDVRESVTRQRDRRNSEVTEVPRKDCHAYGLFSIEHHVMVVCIICTNIQQFLEAKWRRRKQDHIVGIIQVINATLVVTARRRKQDHIVGIIQVINATLVVTAITTLNKETGQFISVHIKQKRR